MTIEEISSTIVEHITKHRSARPENPTELRFTCPAHDDHNPSARYNHAKHTWHCDACKTGGGAVDLAKRLNLDIGQNNRTHTTHTTTPTNGKRSRPPKITATYDYRDQAGQFLYQVVRFTPKGFRQRRPDPNKPGAWIWNLTGVQRVLYNLPQVLTAKRANQSIYLTEGEKDADNLTKLGLTATTNPQGAKKWNPTFTEALTNTHVILLPDNDEAGQQHLNRIAPELARACSKLQVLHVPDGAKDVSEWLAAGHGKDELLQLAAQAPIYTPPGAMDAATDALTTDLGNARRLTARHGTDLRYSYTWGKWFTWTGRHWKVDDTGEVERRAKDTVQAMQRHAETLDSAGDPMSEELEKHARKSESRRAIRDMIDLARSEPPIPITIDQLDRHPSKLNVLNGTLDLATGDLTPHDRDDYLTQLIPLEYDEDAQAPTWETFLEVVMNGNQDLVGFLQRWVGYCLTGDVSEQVLLFLYGTGANGKSTFLNALQALLGPYAHAAPADLLMVRNNDQHPTEIAGLFGKRLVVSNEIEAGRRLAEVLVKQLTGGDKITARRMREDFWSFDPTHKIILAGNHKPIVRGQDLAIWRRIRLVPFTVTIPEKSRDPELPGILNRELPGILAWAVQGAIQWRERGLDAPDEVKAATESYREEMDVLGAFIRDTCLIDQNAQVPVSDMYEAYRQWTEEGGSRPLSKRNFNTQLEEKGEGRWWKDRGNYGKHTWFGIGLVDGALPDRHGAYLYPN